MGFPWVFFISFPWLGALICSYDAYFRNLHAANGAGNRALKVVFTARSGNWVSMLQTAPVEAAGILVQPATPLKSFETICIKSFSIWIDGYVGFV
jgi:hypothetical protein